MWHWVTSSSRPGVLAAVALLAAVLTWPAAGKVFLTVDEALALVYPDCRVERGTVYLTEEQRAETERRAGEEVPSAVVHPYRATCDGAPGGTAYFDVHRVRTLEETLMVALDAAGRVMRVEVLAFREPEEYLPRELWYQQFEGRELGPELQVKRAIHGVTGATLTARATTEAVRRALALHAVLNGDDSGDGGGGGGDGEAEAAQR